MKLLILTLGVAATLSACAPFNTPFGVVGGDAAAKEFFGPINNIDQAKSIFGSDGRITGRLSDGSRIHEWVSVSGPKLRCRYVRMTVVPDGRITFKSWEGCAAYY